ncbi:related to SGT2-cochaperone, glutamine-rich cytoplasmic protein [Ustilago bromivora]|uniref:Related to SGT2 \|nr:related to SGT2-cochaperone, glutamine-rich cytoplasmic protein [Ustilago bromivora]SYW76104.1 related to SGT2 \
MSSQQTPLAYAVAQWLQQSSTSLPADQKAKLEQAAKSVSEAFGVDTSSSEQQAKYGSGPGLQAIFDIFLKTQSKMGGSAPTPAAAASGPSTFAPASSSKPSDEDLAKAEQLKAEGNKAMSAKDFGAAIEAYGKAIELNPNSPVYFSNRAAAFSQIGQHDQAIDDAKQASKIDPTFGKAYSRLGHALFSSGRFQEAVKAYSKGVEVDPTNEVLKKGLAASKEQVSSSSSTGASASAPSASRDAVSSPSAGADAGAGTGEFPNFGGGAGGMPDLASMMNNPMIAQMAQNLMSNPDSLTSLMNNPMLRQAAERFGSGGGMPDMNAMMNDPAMRDMARNFMSGAGRGAGGNNGGNNNNMYG